MSFSVNDLMIFVCIGMKRINYLVVFSIVKIVYKMSVKVYVFLNIICFE